MRAMVVALALLVGGCTGKPAELTITDGMVRLNANPRAPSVAYFTVKGGASDDRLIDVTSPTVIRTELHESMTAGGMATMKPITGGIAVPAGGEVNFEQGGKHVMLYDVNPIVKPDMTMAFTFTFASGTRLSSMLPVRGAGG